MTPEPLLGLYGCADDEVRLRGRLWYPETKKLLAKMAKEHDRRLDQVVAVFAILSVAASLKSNFEWTEEVLRGVRRGGRYPNVQGPLIAGALASDDPVQFVRGPKTNPFYRAIMGDLDALVIDRWAARAVGHTGTGHDLGVRTRRAMEEAYRQAAFACNESLRDFQAIVWIALRETTPNKRHGKVPKLWDVTQNSE